MNILVRLSRRLLGNLDPVASQPPTDTSAPLNVETCLGVKHIRAGEVIGYQEIRNKVITTAFVTALVDAFQAAAYVNNWKYHASGTGTNAEAIGDAALQTPIAEVRDAGTQEEGATANIYKSVATHTYAGTFAITEHGLFDAAAVGVLADRSVFSAVNVVPGDRIEFTFQMSLVAGG